MRNNFLNTEPIKGYMWMNQLKTVLLLGALTGLLLVIGQAIGGMDGLTIAFGFAIIMNVGTYWFSDKIVLAMYGGKQVSKKQEPELHHMVENICKKADLPKPRIFILPIDTPNAFATGRSPKKAAVACTKGILRLLNKHELEGVLAHELAHIKNRDTLISTIAATIAGVISYVAFMARFAAFFGGSRDRDGSMFEMIALAILTPIIAVIIQLAISRSREYLADESGARFVNSSKGLASALQKLHLSAKNNPLQFGNKATASLFIVNPFSARGLTGLFSTHPPMEERVRRLNNLEF